METLVLVEADSALRKRISTELHRLGFAVFACRNASEALGFLWVSPPGTVDHLWIEQNLSDITGTEFLWYALETRHVFTRIVLTSTDFEKEGEVEDPGPGSRIVCLKRPFAIEQLRNALKMGRNS